MHEIAPREVHPVEQVERRVLDRKSAQGLHPTRVELDAAERAVEIAPPRAGAAIAPGRADPADEKDPGVEMLRQIDGAFTHSQIDIGPAGRSWPVHGK